MTAHGGSGSEMVFGWFASERERRRKVRFDRKHLEPRARRFLKIYLNADETRKPEFYQAVQEASEQCRPSGSSLPPLELEDAQVAEATSSAAMQIALERSALNKKRPEGAAARVPDDRRMGAVGSARGRRHPRMTRSMAG